MIKAVQTKFWDALMYARAGPRKSGERGRAVGVAECSLQPVYARAHSCSHTALTAHTVGALGAEVALPRARRSGLFVYYHHFLYVHRRLFLTGRLTRSK